ncbi:unnamed protein product [Caenorhabditis auriculariae]|uniref:Uncharacterized protein n=1 Tax=Caenorhabditis auriculariae TaxID=2777116 RepID=A0A8S1HUD1_9PELO|nr:unnamed protein product [Caenorhabditis auriculariae]
MALRVLEKLPQQLSISNLLLLAAAVGSMKRLADAVAASLETELALRLAAAKSKERNDKNEKKEETKRDKKELKAQRRRFYQEIELALVEGREINNNVDCKKDSTTAAFACSESWCTQV